MIKISAQDLASIGATDADGFISALLAKVKSLETVANSAAGLSEMCKSLTTDLAAANGKIATLETKLAAVQPMDEAKVKSLAEGAASRITTEALAKVGQNVLPSAPADPGAKDGVANMIAAGDYEGAYNASNEIKAEFSSAKTYAAYMKASKSGNVRLFEKSA